VLAVPLEVEGVLYFKGHLVYTRDPSGSIFKAYRSIRIDCGGGSKDLVPIAASIQEANRPLKTGCIVIILLCNSVEFPLDSTASIGPT